MNQYGLNSYDAEILIKEKDIADYFEECLKINIDAKSASNWITTQILGYLNKTNQNIKDIYLTPERLKDLINEIEKETISSKQAKEIFEKVLEEKKDIKAFLNKENAQINNKEEIEKIIEEILSNNPNQIEEYKNGKTNLFDYFVGQVMKNTKGKVNPVLTKEILTEKLK